MAWKYPTGFKKGDKFSLHQWAKLNHITDDIARRLLQDSGEATCVVADTWIWTK